MKTKFVADPDEKALNDAILVAHEAGHDHILAKLYTQAADRADARHDARACCFYLTQSYVFALAAGMPAATALQARLAAFGCEEPICDTTEPPSRSQTK